MNSTLRAVLRTAGLVAFAVPAAAQITQITTSARPHLDAAICADGQHVAFRAGSAAIGFVHFDGSGEAIVHTSAANALSSFAWHPNSVDLFFADGGTIHRVNVMGAPPSPLGTVAGSDVRVSCVDPAGANVFGTRRDVASNTAFVWRMPAAGGAAVDLTQRQGTIDEVRIDDVGRYLLFRSWNGTPAPSTFVRFDQQTSGVVAMKTFTDLAESAHWLVSPLFFTVSVRSPANATQQIAQVSASGLVTFLTDDPLPHGRAFAILSGASHHIAHETTSPTGGGTTIGLVPNHGGGVMLLHTGGPLVLNGGASTGGLSFDAAESRLAFCAGTSASDPNPQIFTARIHGDPHVHPTVEIGMPFSVDAHVHDGRIGIVAFAFSLAPAATVIPPLTGELWLQTAGLATVLFGVGNATGELSVPMTVPLDPGFVGLRVWFQGAEFTPAFVGKITRFGYFQVF